MNTNHLLQNANALIARDRENAGVMLNEDTIAAINSLLDSGYVPNSHDDVTLVNYFMAANA